MELARCLLLGWLVMLAQVAFPVPANAQRLDLTQDWRFHRGEAMGADAVAFDDDDWKRVSVPHDWAIMDRPDGTPPFDPAAAGGQDSGYLPGGIGWYRRVVTLDAAAAARVARLAFEAVYMDARVWVNGKQLAHHAYGYSAFAIDLTGVLKPGRNVIAVRVNHQDPSSRWYAGSGIIRPVHLDLLDPVHMDRDGLFITTPVATAEHGEVSVETPVRNRGDTATTVELFSAIVDGNGRNVAEMTDSRRVDAGGVVSFRQRLAIARPNLWSPDTPDLYHLRQTVSVAGRPLDTRTTRFGIRHVTFDAKGGLRVNGEAVLLRGGNIHHDNYMLGAAGWPDADRRKVAVMKAAGYNAIRSAHNPASQATLDAADALGILVIDEAFDMWNQSKRDKDYARFFARNWRDDVTSMVTSARNHPSVILWSIGNEIPEQGTEQGVETARRLVAHIRELDPTRPATQGVNIDSPASAAQYAELGVAGYNYRAHLFAGDHATHPDRVMYSSESVSKDAFDYWRAAETMPWVIGDFVWTAIDYIGESGIGWMGYSHDWKKLGPYPWHLAYSGEIDVLGNKRPAAFYREVLWKTGAPIAAFVRQPTGTADLPGRAMFDPPAPLDWSLEDVHPSWTWPGQEQRPLEVVVYSTLPEVELRLNGKRLGRRPVNLSTQYQTSFTVPYEPGTLEAIGYRDGQAVSRWHLRTAGPAARVRVTIDRTNLSANGRDLAYVMAQLVDEQGVPVYAQAGDLDIAFRVSGAGRLAGAGSGDPQRPASFQSGRIRTFHGRATGVVQAGTMAGPVIVEVTAAGLPVERLTLHAETPD